MNKNIYANKIKVRQRRQLRDRGRELRMESKGKIVTPYEQSKTVWILFFFSLDWVMDSLYSPTCASY